jgi:hypothetical protein
MIDIKKALAEAEAERSKIPGEYITRLTGLSSPKVWHCLNNLCAQSDTYLEIGTYMGSSLMAALYNNTVEAYAVDNFCMKPTTRNHFFQNVKKLNFTFIEKDCFEIKPEEIKHPIELYFYDGEHSRQSQYNAIKHFLPMMKSEFVYVCDDWTNGPVKEGTMEAIKDCGLEVVEMEVRGDGKLKDKGGWWCGFAIIKLKKI